MPDAAALLPGTLDLLILKAVSLGRQRLGEEVARWNRRAEAIAMALRTSSQEI